MPGGKSTIFATQLVAGGKSKRASLQISPVARTKSLMSGKGCQGANQQFSPLNWSPEANPSGRHYKFASGTDKIVDVRKGLPGGRSTILATKLVTRGKSKRGIIKISSGAHYHRPSTSPYVPSDVFKSHSQRRYVHRLLQVDSHSIPESHHVPGYVFRT